MVIDRKPSSGRDRGSDLFLGGALVRVTCHLPEEGGFGSWLGPEVVDSVHGASRSPEERAFALVAGALLGQVAHGAHDPTR